MSDKPPKRKFEILQGGKGDQDKKRAEERALAHALYYNPMVELDMITEGRLELLLDHKLYAKGQEDTHDADVLYENGGEVLYQLMYFLSKSSAQKTYNKEEVHATLEGMLHTIIERKIKNHEDQK